MMSKNFIIGIDLGGTNLKIALLSKTYKILKANYLSTRKFRTKEELILALIHSINNLIKNNGLKKERILGVGLGLPGPVDFLRGLVHFFPNIPGWKDVSLKRILEKKLKLPVFIDNDANLMALAEYKLGAAKGSQNAVCLTLGTGVGGGIIIAGRLYRGGAFAAGEVGHMPINESGPACNCGGEACLEAYIGNNRILGRARKIFGNEISLEGLSRLARKGNQKAIAQWKIVGRYLGVALSGVINLLNPDCVVIGGGVAKAGKVLFQEISRVIRDRAMAVQSRAVRILPAELGNDAGLIGAAILVSEGIKR